VSHSDGMSSNSFLDLSYIPWILVGRYKISRRFALATDLLRRLVDHIEVVHLESAHVRPRKRIGLRYSQSRGEHLGKTDPLVSQSL